MNGVVAGDGVHLVWSCNSGLRSTYVIGVLKLGGLLAAYDFVGLEGSVERAPKMADRLRRGWR